MRVSNLMLSFTLAAALLAPVMTPSFAFAAPAKNPGDKARDGTVFAGLSPEANAPMYTVPEDAPRNRRYTWEDANEYCAKSRALGNRDWVLPSLAELDVLKKNEGKGDLAGTFMASGHAPALYWSANERKGSENYAAWVFRFDKEDNNAVWTFKDGDAAVRCIRRGQTNKPG